VAKQLTWPVAAFSALFDFAGHLVCQVLLMRNENLAAFSGFGEGCQDGHVSGAEGGRQCWNDRNSFLAGHQHSIDRVLREI
jgi:hypothetical protein